MKWNERITLARKRKGLNKTEFWRLLKVSSATATNWENGVVKSIKGENLVNVCRVLGVSEDWLLYGTGENGEDKISIIEAKQHKKRSKLIQNLTSLMESCDERGQEKIFLAAIDAYELHQAQKTRLSAEIQRISEINKAMTNDSSNDYVVESPLPVARQ